MTLTPALIQHYDSLWRRMEPFDDAAWTRARVIAAQVVRGETRYRRIVQSLDLPRFPWWMVGILHCRENEECFFSDKFYSNIANGQNWSEKTTIAPKGLGPYESFEAAASHALVMKLDAEARRFQWATADQAAYFLEKWNGFGYLWFRPCTLSPYLVGGSNLETYGRYVSDGKWDPRSLGAQLGALLIAKALVVDGVATIDLPDTNFPAGAASLKADAGTFEIARLQEFLNAMPRLKGDPDTEKPLKVDGVAGRKTHKRFVEVFGRPMAGTAIRSA